MKKFIWIVVLAGIVAFILALSIQETHTAEAQTKVDITPTPTLTYQQKAWLGALEWCESRGTPEAVNPKDRDNTPSYGILQFKPDTYYEFGKLYGINTKPGYRDPRTQIKIVEQMILRGGIKWSQQFPECTRMLGLPPKTPTPSIDKKQ